MRRAGIFACLVLASCAGGGDWVKPGADAEATRQVYLACQEAAGGALATDRAIDQDITASRGRDWERARTFSTQRETMRAQARAHVDAVIDGCMRAHGFSRAK